MHRLALTTAMVVVLAAGNGNAFDAAGADIIGLRLGMPEAEILVRLARQGFSVTRSQGSLTTTTRDGQLTVDLASDRGAVQIRYTFAARQPGEPETIRAAIINRFGAPDQSKPMTWCRTLGSDGLCQKDAASMTFLVESTTLMLREARQKLP